MVHAQPSYCFRTGHAYVLNTLVPNSVWLSHDFPFDSNSKPHPQEAALTTCLHVLLVTCLPHCFPKNYIMIYRHRASPTSSFISVLTRMCIPHLFGAIDPTSLLKRVCWLMVHGAYLFIQGNRLRKLDQAKPLCSVTASKEPWVLFRNMSFFSFPGQFTICYVPCDSDLVVFPSASCWSSGNAGHLKSCGDHRQVGGALVRRLLNDSFWQPKSFWGTLK